MRAFKRDFIIKPVSIALTAVFLITTAVWASPGMSSISAETLEEASSKTLYSDITGTLAGPFEVKAVLRGADVRGFRNAILERRSPRAKKLFLKASRLSVKGRTRIFRDRSRTPIDAARKRRLAGKLIRICDYVKECRPEKESLLSAKRELTEFIKKEAASLGSAKRIQSLFSVEPESFGRYPWLKDLAKKPIDVRTFSREYLKAILSQRGVGLSGESAELFSKILIYDYRPRTENIASVSPQANSYDVLSNLFSVHPRTREPVLFSVIKALSFPESEIPGKIDRSTNFMSIDLDAFAEKINKRQSEIAESIRNHGAKIHFVDIGDGRKGRAVVTLVVIEYEKGIVQFVAGADRKLASFVESTTSREDSPGYRQFCVSLRDRKETALIPRHYYFAESGYGSETKVVYKEFVPGTPLDTWVLDKMLKGASEKNETVLIRILFGLGKLFGRFYRETGTWPKDAHSGNVVIRVDEGNRVFLNLIDYSGKVRFFNDIAYEILDFGLREISGVLNVYHIKDEVRNQFRWYFFRGLEESFPSRDDADKFFERIIKSFASYDQKRVRDFINSYKRDRDNSLIVNLDVASGKNAPSAEAESLGRDGSKSGRSKKPALQTRLRKLADSINPFYVFLPYEVTPGQHSNRFVLKIGNKKYIVEIKYSIPLTNFERDINEEMLAKGGFESREELKKYLEKNYLSHSLASDASVMVYLVRTVHDPSVDLRRLSEFDIVSDDVYDRSALVSELEENVKDKELKERFGIDIEKDRFFYHATSVGHLKAWAAMGRMGGLEKLGIEGDLFFEVLSGRRRIFFDSAVRGHALTRVYSQMIGVSDRIAAEAALHYEYFKELWEKRKIDGPLPEPLDFSKRALLRIPKRDMSHRLRRHGHMPILVGGDNFRTTRGTGISFKYLRNAEIVTEEDIPFVKGALGARFLDEFDPPYGAEILGSFDDHDKRMRAQYRSAHATVYLKDKWKPLGEIAEIREESLMSRIKVWSFELFSLFLKTVLPSWAVVSVALVFGVIPISVPVIAGCTVMVPAGISVALFAALKAALAVFEAVGGLIREKTEAKELSRETVTEESAAEDITEPADEESAAQSLGSGNSVVADEIALRFARDLAAMVDELIVRAETGTLDELRQELRGTSRPKPVAAGEFSANFVPSCAVKVKRILVQVAGVSGAYAVSETSV